MKSQQGFIVFGAVVWLATTLLVGVFIGVVETAISAKETTATQSQDQSTLKQTQTAGVDANLTKAAESR